MFSIAPIVHYLISVSPRLCPDERQRPATGSVTFFMLLIDPLPNRQPQRSSFQLFELSWVDLSPYLPQLLFLSFKLLTQLTDLLSVQSLCHPTFGKPRQLASNLSKLLLDRLDGSLQLTFSGTELSDGVTDSFLSFGVL